MFSSLDMASGSSYLSKNSEAMMNTTDKKETNTKPMPTHVFVRIVSILLSGVDCEMNETIKDKVISLCAQYSAY